MIALAGTSVLFGLFAVVHCAPSDVSCPVPLSPVHGQVFMYQEGRVVKYACEPGYVLNGKEISRCVDGKWEDPNTTCIEYGANNEESGESTGPLPPPPPRSLFKWDDDSEENQDENNQQESNSTSEEMPMSDEARVHLLMYPRRPLVTSAKVKSGTELEEEDKKRSRGQSETSIHLEAPPSMVYVRRTVVPGKSDASRQALHMTVENGHNVEVVSIPQNDKGQTTDDYYRQLYWYSQYYPRSASLVDYRTGMPTVMTLTESQLAWINSLHPELRDQYLKNYYVIRDDRTAESQNTLAYLRRYDDAYNYYYHYPYLRQPMAMSMVVEDPISIYDYSCHQSGNPFVKAPKLRNMHIARYDRRQNPNRPNNHYLSAVYRCNPGFVMLDTRYTELHCSKKSWIGVKPVCVRRA